MSTNGPRDPHGAGFEDGLDGPSGIGSSDELLRAEQQFLLESLRDLERERAAGDIDEVDYATLRDGYIARAAAVTRRLERGDEPWPGDPDVLDADTEGPDGRRRAPWMQRIVAVLVVLALAAGSGVWVARQSGQRLPGETATGGIEQSTAGLLATARALNFTDPARAVQLYSDVLKVEPDNVEALTYRSWILALTAREAPAEVKKLALATAVADLGRAQSVDPEYPDSRCLLGVIYFRFLENAALAEPQLTMCKEMNPPAEVAGLVDSVLAQVREELGR